MATSSLIRLFTALLMIMGLALSSSLAWAQDTRYETEDERIDQQQQQQQEQPGAQQFPPQEQPMQQEQQFTQQRGPSTAWIVTRSALLGGVVGALIGTGGYFLSGQDWSPWVIAYTAGGGLALGATVGLIDALTRDDQAGMASLEYLERDLPKAVQVRVLNLKF
ncbi:MAG: hypothetical protein H0U74_09635 [Bradymonadaceae bacterium]|nr:hypothetical protein [Lujinxingiaceae bacterium]